MKSKPGRLSQAGGSHAQTLQISPFTETFGANDNYLKNIKAFSGKMKPEARGCGLGDHPNLFLGYGQKGLTMSSYSKMRALPIHTALHVILKFFSSRDGGLFPSPL